MQTTVLQHCYQLVQLQFLSITISRGACGCRLSGRHDGGSMRSARKSRRAVVTAAAAIAMRAARHVAPPGLRAHAMPMRAHMVGRDDGDGVRRVRVFLINSPLRHRPRRRHRRPSLTRSAPHGGQSARRSPPWRLDRRLVHAL